MRIVAVAVAAAVVAAVSPRLAAQQIPLTDKITPRWTPKTGH